MKRKHTLTQHQREIIELRMYLDTIKEIIEGVDHRAMAADGPVTPTLKEMTQAEMTEIYENALGGSNRAHELAKVRVSEAAKDEAARLGLWKTMHALDEATRTVGWELADQILKARKGK